MFRRLLQVADDGPWLAKAQVQAFSKQVPLLYLILLINTLALSYTHLRFAPLSLSVGFPLLVGSICIYRVFTWLRTRTVVLTDDEVNRRLRSTVALALVLGLSFVSWALSLHGYGDSYAQGHVAFYIGITVVSCIFCLMHLRSAALIVTASVTLPFAAFMMLSKHEAFVAIAVNMLLVSLAMVYVLIVYSRDFAIMVRTQKELVEKHAELVKLSDENLRLANIDSLTGLPNRRSFFARLSSSLETARAGNKGLAVAIVDLDGFKPINDVHGHGMGDRVLMEVGLRMRQVLDEEAFVARLGGDEFGLIFERERSNEQIVAVCQLMCSSISDPIQFAEATLRLSGSVGIAKFPEAGQESVVLFERADYALYHAKERQRGRPLVFSGIHETAIRRQRLVAEYLREADLEAEMDLVFQPIYDATTKRVISFEALARWKSPVLGAVAPTEFVHAAERNDQIGPLTRVLLGKALSHANTWPKAIGVSFNLSALDISSADAVDKIVAIIVGSGVAPERIDLEITETALIADYDQALALMQNLRRLGVKVSLDDFGTGHSTLSQLYKLPIDKIKIDRSFVQDITINSQSLSVIKTVLAMSESLGLVCIIEGIETAQQVAILRAIGAHFMQGYHFGKPMPHHDIASYLELLGEADKNRSAA